MASWGDSGFSAACGIKDVEAEDLEEDFGSLQWAFIGTEGNVRAF